MTKFINIKWESEDVLRVDPTLSEKQVSDVLDLVKISHDASVGINWEVIEQAINHTKGK